MTAPHASWGAQVHVLPEGVDADLWATALVVDDGVTMAAWIDLDLVIVSRQESDAIRDGRGPRNPSQAVRVSVTHNHAAAAERLELDSPGSGRARRLLRACPNSRRRGEDGTNRLAAGGAAAGSGESRVAVNRRETPDGRPVTGVNPDGPIDLKSLCCALTMRREVRSPRPSATRCTQQRLVPRTG